MFGREKELPVKTEWKKVLKSSAFPVTVIGCIRVVEEYSRGDGAFLA